MKNATRKLIENTLKDKMNQLNASAEHCLLKQPQNPLMVKHIGKLKEKALKLKEAIKELAQSAPDSTEQPSVAAAEE